MNNLPINNNVYGFLFCSQSLENVAQVLRSRLGLTLKQVYVYTSQFDGGQTLHLRTDKFEFEVGKLKEENRWMFTGAVAGDENTVVNQVKLISDHLRWAGYETKFEIYNSEFKCVAVYP